MYMYVKLFLFLFDPEGCNLQQSIIHWLWNVEEQIHALFLYVLVFCVPAFYYYLFRFVRLRSMYCDQWYLCLWIVCSWLPLPLKIIVLTENTTVLKWVLIKRSRNKNRHSGIDLFEKKLLTNMSFTNIWMLINTINVSPFVICISILEQKTVLIASDIVWLSRTPIRKGDWVRSSGICPFKMMFASFITSTRVKS